MKIRNIISLLRNTKTIELKKRQLLIEQGSTEKEVYFIRKGLIRCYQYDSEKLEETTFQLFSEEYNVVTNMHSVLFNEPSKFIYQAHEDTKLYKINYSDLIALTSKNSELLDLQRRFIGKKALKQAFLRVEAFVFLSPEERYAKYISDFPKMVNRVPDKYIAHVLGITPVSLSRIRHRIISK